MQLNPTGKMIADNFQAIGEQACNGHYLDRLITIVEAINSKTDMLAGDLMLLKASREYLRDYCKPAGLDELIYSVSCGVIHIAGHCGLDPIHLAPIAWGLDYDALRDYNLLYLRTAPNTQTPR